MFAKLLFLFIAIPLAELALLVKLGEVLGFWPTIGLVIVTGILGASLAKAQGFMIYARIQQELAAGRMPTGELLDGLLILIGGIVLLTPGLLTDLCGFALLIPPLR
ncbi:MAG: FxsA family protein, partial [Calditrichaeota bacterium]|nr:FxsA family protein [Calditrichota bacterium]